MIMVFGESDANYGRKYGPIPGLAWRALIRAHHRRDKQEDCITECPPCAAQAFCLPRNAMLCYRSDQAFKRPGPQATGQPAHTAPTLVHPAVVLTARSRRSNRTPAFSRTLAFPVLRVSLALAFRPRPLGKTSWCRAMF